MTSPTAWLTLIVFLLQSTPAAAPIRIGDLARRLTSQDLTELERLAAAGGAKGAPWLLEGPFGQQAYAIRMYLPADSQTAQLRRGSAIEGARRPQEAIWSVRQTVQYAQVVEAGRDFNSLTGDLDTRRPFPVSGKFSDEELISLVTYIRTSPDQVKGDWPIGSLSGDASSVMLWLVRPDQSGFLQRVSLVRQGSTWKVTAAMTGIA